MYTPSGQVPRKTPQRRLFPGFLQMQRRESRRIKSYNSVGFRLSCFQLSCCAPALLTIAIGRLSAASCSAFSLPLCLHHVSHVHLRGGGCVVQSRHRKASPNRLHDVSNFLRMQAQDTAYSVSGRIKVVVISGPTAVGKSALAESIAKSLAGGAELISADSVQVYTGMDIGSAKPTPDERSAVKYHLLDIADPTEEYSAANFAADAHVAAKQIASRGALPIVVGGTGFYVQWLVFGSPGAPPATAEAAARAEETIESFAGDWEAAKSAGMKIDAEYCDSVLKDNDWFRLRRVFEVYYSSGRPLSSFDRPQGKNMTPSQVVDALKSAPFDFRCFFLYRSRLSIFKDIDRRCEIMLQQGFMEECVELVRNGKLQLGPTEGPGVEGYTGIATRAIGYRQALDLLWKWKEALRNDPQALTADLQDAMTADFIREFQSASRQFVKRQLSWFRSDATFKWINSEDRQAAQQHLVQQLEMEEEAFHALHLDPEDVHQQQQARGAESGKDEQNALKRYQTKLTIYSTPDRRATLVASIHAGVISI